MRIVGATRIQFALLITIFTFNRAKVANQCVFVIAFMGGYSKVLKREGDLWKRKDDKKIKERLYPKRGDSVSVHYTIKHEGSETVIDCSRQKGMAYTFQCGQAQVIRGLDEAVLKMSLGERAILDISATYGWGRKGVRRIVRPNAGLIVDVEIVAINEKKARLKIK